MKTLPPSCETALFLANNNKAWYVNSNGENRKHSFHNRGSFRFSQETDKGNKPLPLTKMSTVDLHSKEKSNFLFLKLLEITIENSSP